MTFRDFAAAQSRDRKKQIEDQAKDIAAYYARIRERHIQKIKCEKVSLSPASIIEMTLERMNFVKDGAFEFDDFESWRTLLEIAIQDSVDNWLE